MARLTELQPEAPPSAPPTPAAATPSKAAEPAADPIESLQHMLTSPDWYNTIATLLLISETFLCVAIIRFVPCESRVGSWWGAGRVEHRSIRMRLNGGRARWLVSINL